MLLKFKRVTFLLHLFDEIDKDIEIYSRLA